MSLRSEERADWAALNLLFPVLDVMRRSDEAEHWGLGPDDAAKALRAGSLALREGALEVVAAWVTEMEEGPAASWRGVIGPLMSRVWPRERRFKHPRLGRHFAKLAVAAGDAFPDALRQLQPFMTPLEGFSGAYEIENSQVETSGNRGFGALLRF